MPRIFKPTTNDYKFTFHNFFKPIKSTMTDMPPLQSKCNRPLQMTFEDHLSPGLFSP